MKKKVLLLRCSSAYQAQSQERIQHFGEDQIYAPVNFRINSLIS